MRACGVSEPPLSCVFLGQAGEFPDFVTSWMGRWGEGRGEGGVCPAITREARGLWLVRGRLTVKPWFRKPETLVFCVNQSLCVRFGPSRMVLKIIKKDVNG